MAPDRSAFDDEKVTVESARSHPTDFPSSPPNLEPQALSHPDEIKCWKSSNKYCLSHEIVLFFQHYETCLAVFGVFFEGSGFLGGGGSRRAVDVRVWRPERVSRSIGRGGSSRSFVSDALTVGGPGPGEEARVATAGAGCRGAPGVGDGIWRFDEIRMESAVVCESKTLSAGGNGDDLLQ